MKKVCILLLFICFHHNVHAQYYGGHEDVRMKNNISLNGFANAAFLSLNYERLFANTEGFFVATKVGAGINLTNTLGASFGEGAFGAYPVLVSHLSFNFGAENNYFECGAAATKFFQAGNSNYTIYPMIGYRFQPMETSSINFRFIINFPVDGTWFGGHTVLPFGVGLGACF